MSGDESAAGIEARPLYHALRLIRLVQPRRTPDLMVMGSLLIGFMSGFGLLVLGKLVGEPEPEPGEQAHGQRLWRPRWAR